MRIINVNPEESVKVSSHLDEILAPYYADFTIRFGKLTIRTNSLVEIHKQDNGKIKWTTLGIILPDGCFVCYKGVDNKDLLMTR